MNIRNQRKIKLCLRVPESINLRKDAFRIKGLKLTREKLYTWKKKVVACLNILTEGIRSESSSEQGPSKYLLKRHNKDTF